MHDDNALFKAVNILKRALLKCTEHVDLTPSTQDRAGELRSREA